MRYLPVSVMTNPAYGDTTNNGVTHRMPDRLVVECEDGHLTHEEVVAAGDIILKLKTIVFMDKKHVSFKPEDLDGHSMFGGNFVWSSDSRFSKTYGSRPIHVHDRVER